MKRRATRALGVALAAFAAFALTAAALAALVAWLNLRGEAPLGAAAPAVPRASPPDTALIARGAYLAKVGNCSGCHTAPAGAAYAGGRGVPTPFGTVYATNLTPDVATGLGAWTADEFWRALHHGRSRDGRLLYPAFPYPNYTHVSRADADAIHAYLASLAPVAQPNRPHELAFPFDRQAALAVWRALYFRAEPARLDASRSAAWNRGAYLVEGLGHCNACHARRNPLGASTGPHDLAGGLIPVQNWYAPSLASTAEAGVADGSTAQVTALMALLRSGVSAQSAVSGPMREVVAGSTQHLTDADLHAVAVYLQSLPTADRNAAPRATVASAGTEAPPDGPGARLYETHCAACHGERGEGVASVYPALAGNRAITLPTPANLVHIVLEGGFPPSTDANPRPYGMPPFATVLSDTEVAQVLSHLRGSWGNRAAPVEPFDVARFAGTR